MKTAIITKKTLFCLIDHPEKAHRQISLILTYQRLISWAILLLSSRFFLKLIFRTFQVKFDFLTFINCDQHTNVKRKHNNWCCSKLLWSSSFPHTLLCSRLTFVCLSQFVNAIKSIFFRKVSKNDFREKTRA